MKGKGGTPDSPFPSPLTPPFSSFQLLIFISIAFIFFLFSGGLGSIGSRYRLVFIASDFIFHRLLINHHFRLGCVQRV